MQLDALHFTRKVIQNFGDRLAKEIIEIVERIHRLIERFGLPNSKFIGLPQ